MSKPKKAAAQKADGGSYRPKKGGQLKVIYRPTDSLVAYERNSRTHTDWQIKQVADSIKEFGWTNPILGGRGAEVRAAAESE